jgi:hypothetical protein
VVEGARLESVYRGDSIVGSNPTVSASFSALARKRDRRARENQARGHFGDDAFVTGIHLESMRTILKRRSTRRPSAGWGLSRLSA